MKPTVSVVIPAYGRELLLKQAVLAALNQELEPTEVIVSDDNSLDNTLDMLYQLAENNVSLKILESKSNSGGVNNWNKAIGAARSEYIAYCSDDDYYLPHHLKTSISYLEQNPDIDMVHSGYLNLLVPPVGIPELTLGLIKNNVFVIHRKSAIEHMIRQVSYPFQPSTLVFRKSLWESVGPFDPNFSVADTDWFVRASMSHRIAFLPVISVVNRRHSGNWSNRVGSVAMNLEFHDMLKKAFLEISNDLDQRSYRVLKFSWLIAEIKKFTRIYISRSRAGFHDISMQSADVIWKIFFKSRKGLVYRAYLLFASLLSILLRLVQRFLPGGRSKYLSLGQACPK